MNKLGVRDLDAAGKKVLVRVDFNVPIEDGKVNDDTRIRAALPTIRLLLTNGAAVILMSHLGRPNGRVVDAYRLRPAAERLTMLLGRYVPTTGDALGAGTLDAVNRLKPGQVLMLENLRFHSEEEANDPKFAKTLASYGNAYVNDAFGTAHRAHASTVGITEYLPAYAGLLMEREIEVLSRLLENPERPFAAVLGGAKVSGKINVLDSLVKRVDTIVVGGGMANTFLLARGQTVGKSLAEKDKVEDARRILAAAEERGVAFVLPTDVVVAKEVTRGAERKIVAAHKIPNSWSVVDVGPQSREAFEAALETARTVFWNGPLGVFEVPTFGDGTRQMARYLARRAEEGATVVVGGGDSVAAVEQLGLADKMTHLSTGGGASLEYLENGDLPGIAALLDREPAGEQPPLTAPTEPVDRVPVVAARAAAPERPPAQAVRPSGEPRPIAPAPATPAAATPLDLPRLEPVRGAESPRANGKRPRPKRAADTAPRDRAQRPQAAARGRAARGATTQKAPAVSTGRTPGGRPKAAGRTPRRESARAGRDERKPAPRTQSARPPRASTTRSTHARTRGSATSAARPPSRTKGSKAKGPSAKRSTGTRSPATSRSKGSTGKLRSAGRGVEAKPTGSRTTRSSAKRSSAGKARSTGKTPSSGKRSSTGKVSSSRKESSAKRSAARRTTADGKRSAGAGRSPTAKKSVRKLSAKATTKGRTGKSDRKASSKRASGQGARSSNTTRRTVRRRPTT